MPKVFQPIAKPPKPAAQLPVMPEKNWKKRVAKK